MNLRGRVGRLESRTPRARAAARCPSCRASPTDALVYACDPPRVIGEHGGDDDRGPDVCPGCDRVLVYRCDPPRELTAAGVA